MRTDAFTANGPPAEDLQQLFSDWLAQSETPPDFLALHQSVPSLEAGLDTLAPAAGALHGATSCLGVMGAEGPKLENGAGAFAIWDPEGSYGTAMAALDGDPRAAARQATEAALDAADRTGEAPEVIWLSASPGQEELVLAGIEDVVGAHVPVLGGSAADNTVSGEWRVFDRGRSLQDGVIVSVLFPSGPVSFAYHNGYAPTPHSGIVTAAEGRLLKEIDGRPAAEVYREWTGGSLIPARVTERTAILSESTLAPLGRYLDSVSSVPYFLLSHPAGLTPDDALELFADVQEGDSLTLMTGSPDQLTQRAGKVASLAVQAGKFAPEAIAGALMVYCGGCMLAVRDRLEDVTDGVRAALPGVPFLGVFTFGEQGVVMDGRNRHGNLMISAIIFGV